MIAYFRMAAGAFAALLLGAAPAFAGALFSDSTFNLGNYSASAAFSSDATASIGYLQCGACGNPGNALQFNAVFTSGLVGTPQVAQALVNTGFSYDPLTQGAIASISAAIDKNISVNVPGVGFGNTFRPAIEQGGVFYLAAIAGAPFNGPNAPGGTGYLGFSNTALLAADFSDYDFTTGTFGSLHPNFASGTMLFGLAQISGIASAAGTLTTQYDNLSFTIRDVPEPVTVTLFGTGLFGLGMLRRRRKD